MALSFDQYTYSSGPADFAITFTYTKIAEISVKLNGVVQATPADYTFTGPAAKPTGISFVGALTPGDIVLIERTTDLTTRVVDWEGGTSISEPNLDNSDIQWFHACQENRENFEQFALILDPADNKWEGLTHVFKNLGAGVADTDAATIKQLNDLGLGVGVILTLDNFFVGDASNDPVQKTPAEVRTILSLVPGTDVQAQSVNLQDIADIAGLGKGDILVYDGSDLVKLTVGPDGKFLKAKAATATGLEWGDELDPVTLPVASETVQGIIELATSAETTTGADDARAVTPLKVNDHLGVAKAWAKVDSGGTILDSHNITSVAKNATGDYTVTLDTDFADADYVILIGPDEATTRQRVALAHTQAAGTFDVHTGNPATDVASDEPFWFACYGVQ